MEAMHEVTCDGLFHSLSCSCGLECQQWQGDQAVDESSLDTSYGLQGPLLSGIIQVPVELVPRGYEDQK